MEGKGEFSFVFFEDFGSLIMGASGGQVGGKRLTVSRALSLMPQKRSYLRQVIINKSCLCSNTTHVYSALLRVRTITERRIKRMV